MPEWLDLLASCRMVLCVTPDRSPLQQLREHGIPAVGLVADEALANELRQAGIAAFAAPLQCLRSHRHKFDGALVELDALTAGEQEQLASLLEEAVAPGGQLVLCRQGSSEHSRRSPAVWPLSPGLVTGPYADLMAGCR
ncbi:MAG: hypothetical protein KDC98_07465, partial [Planctomycetes bacterium]|nr:hypothetical protein [Planctomycetota bacterium]